MDDEHDRILRTEDGARSDETVDKSINTPEYRQLIDYLRKLREQVGLTQAQLAGRIGERKGFVSDYERLQRRLDVMEIRTIAAAIGGPAKPVVAVLDALHVIVAADDPQP